MKFSRMYKISSGWKKLNDAKKGFEYLISKYPNSPDLLNSLGTLHLQLGNKNNGISLLKKSLISIQTNLL